MVACETSTGINNPWEQLAAYSRSQGLLFCLDAISAIGANPVNLENVDFASGVSGKAIGAFPGIALVFRNGPLPASGRNIPRALDLAQYLDAAGIPYTLSSNLLAALSRALTETDWAAKHARIARASARLRRQLHQRGLMILASGEHASPAVMTIVLPREIDSVSLCESLRRYGCELGGHSSYLVERNWIQICLFGEFDEETLDRVVDMLSMHVRHQGKHEKDWRQSCHKGD
jgi:aspartate aminotransferase-like enzyme